MLLAQECPNEDGLILERRNALTVMRIQKHFKRNGINAPIYIEELMKGQSTGFHKIQSLEKRKLLPRVFVLERNKLSWYHDL